MQRIFEERLRIERDVPAELSDLLVPPLILQPIVENAVKHGISPLREGGTISIRAHLESDMAGQGERLHLSVHDTGGGMTRRAAVGHQRGVGLDNVKNRLLRYYGEEGQLHIRSNASGGTLVELSLAVNRWPAAVSVS